MRIDNNFSNIKIKSDTVKAEDMKVHKVNKVNKLNQAYGSYQDKIEISNKGREFFKIEHFTKDKTYDLAKVLDIHKKGFSQIPSREESEYYWNARKSDPVLDQALYDSDKAKILEEMIAIKLILMKIATGQALTEEEKEMVKKDPNLQAAMEYNNLLK